MKTKQQEQAKELYFQTNMNKTEIAEKVGVTRKTILYWAKQHDWDKLRLSARTMPSLVAEKCYYVIDQYLNNLLAEGSNTPSNPLQLKDAQTLHLLATTIKKLKNRSTINESMEMFNNFIDCLDRRNPKLAEQIKPEIEEYITLRNEVEGNNELARDLRNGEQQPHLGIFYQERYLDKKQALELENDYVEFLNSREEVSPFAPAPEYCTEETPHPAATPTDPPPGEKLNEAA